MESEWIRVACLVGILMDILLGDPIWLPHPVVGFGKLIAFFEHRFNKGTSAQRRIAGGLVAGGLILGVFLAAATLLCFMAEHCPICAYIFIALSVFFCLAQTTLIREVKDVFKVVDRSVEEGRIQVARIVGRDTANLKEQEIRTAALETLAENLSDGVIAPLFWYILLGVPGMLMYKMVNTLDSMIGYKNARYKDFGRFAAKTDDVFNYFPARLTAYIMVIVSGNFKVFSFLNKYAHCHASPNSGYPEAAMAGILDCRFGGPHDYFGEEVWKPYIGENERSLTTNDLRRAVRVCRLTALVFIILTLI